MDAGDVITLGVGVVAAVIAIVSVVVAAKANTRSDHANRAAAEANRIASEALEVQKRTAPPAWSGAQRDGKSRLSFRNESGRTLIVVAADAQPTEAESMLSIYEELPSRVEYGDTYDVQVLQTWGASPEILTLTWRFEDESETRKTERRLF